MKRRRRYGTGSVFFKGRVWWLQYSVDGQRLTENSGTSDRDTAEQILKARVAESVLRPIDVAEHDLTIARICQLVLEDNRIRKLRDLRSVEYRFRAHVMPNLGKLLAQRVSRQHFANYIDQRRQEGAADSSINRELAVVRRAYNLALREDPPLVRRAPFIPTLVEENVRQGFLEESEYARLLEALPDRLKALFVCGYHIGARKTELRLIRWDQVDLDGGLIRLAGTQTKNKKPRTLPIYGDMPWWLRRQWENRKPQSPWVFYGPRGTKIGHHLTGWREACERVGVPHLIFHDLRRSAIRNMKRAGLQDQEAMEISGHRTRRVFERYNIIDEGNLGSVARRLNEFSKEEKKRTRAKLEVVK